MPTTGEKCGPYRLGVCLGEGAFGSVHEATHQDSGERVAVKLLHGSKQLEPEVQNRFVREVSLLSRLDHDNIVRHHDAGLHNGNIYCAMELVECGSLKEVLQERGMLPWREAAEVALQLCRALHHAHDNGCVHRDLKPANLYLSEDGLVKLGDLGLARDLNSDRLTQQGQTVGTWRYMAPEQITGEENIDGRLDLYATGCILFEMIAGRVPFDGVSFYEIFDQHLDSTPPRLDVLTADCPREMADLVDDLLKKSPDERPQDAAEVIERLTAMLEGRTPEIERTEKPIEDTLSDSQVDALNLTQRLRQGPAVEQRKAQFTTLAIVAVLILLIVIAFAVF